MRSCIDKNYQFYIAYRLGEFRRELEDFEDVTLLVMETK